MYIYIYIYTHIYVHRYIYIYIKVYRYTQVFVVHRKTIIKPIETDTVIKDSKDEFEKYVSLNHNYIDSVLEVNGRYYIKKLMNSEKLYHYD